MNDALDHFLKTGEHDSLRYGASLDGLTRAHHEMLEGLIEEVRRRAKGRRSPRVPRGFEPTVFARRKLEPMVRGLFSQKERDLVLSMLERSVVFVSRRNVVRLMREANLLSTARTLADLYLGMVGAPLLSEDSPRLVGFNEQWTCYVSTLYFREPDPFSDFVVHEAAHMFHNCKRRMVGLPHTRRKEWLLDVDFHQRETFAYACEVYSQVVGRAHNAAERRALAEEFAADPWQISDPCTDSAEVVELVRQASHARNGWKVILGACAPTRPGRIQGLQDHRRSPGA